ncbi:hypothetical protein RND71_004878 [Anisodus tanguticus]|uniref:RNase H type-1 domain-containing protein n=1 Tax=Anisodus tanguticus TaxID=243964 RepID=A0AAE1VRT2_9SOLA|nr:hypothetical protein RND71_004878 [Anisodus tanguticus]
MGMKGVFIDHTWDWKGICREVETLRTRITSQMVIWEKPQDDWIKINTDGSSNNRVDTAGIDGVVRNRNGEIIMAFAKSLQFCTNNSAEVEAADFAIQWCLLNNMDKIILELDSMFVVNLLKRNSFGSLEPI